MECVGIEKQACLKMYFSIKWWLFIELHKLPETDSLKLEMLWEDDGYVHLWQVRTSTLDLMTLECSKLFDFAQGVGWGDIIWLVFWSLWSLCIPKPFFDCRAVGNFLKNFDKHAGNWEPIKNRHSNGAYRCIYLPLKGGPLPVTGRVITSFLGIMSHQLHTGFRPFIGPHHSICSRGPPCTYTYPRWP